jgi:hypothetical protein
MSNPATPRGMIATSNTVPEGCGHKRGCHAILQGECLPKEQSYGFFGMRSGPEPRPSGHENCGPVSSASRTVPLLPVARARPILATRYSRA